MVEGGWHFDRGCRCEDAVVVDLDRALGECQHCARFADDEDYCDCEGGSFLDFETETRLESV